MTAVHDCDLQTHATGSILAFQQFILRLKVFSSLTGHHQQRPSDYLSSVPQKGVPISSI